MSYLEILTFGDGEPTWEPINPDDLWNEMESEDHPLGMPIAFRDEHGDEFWKLASLHDEVESFVGAIVRRIKDGFVYTTPDCRQWDLVQMPKRVIA